MVAAGGPAGEAGFERASWLMRLTPPGGNTSTSSSRHSPSSSMMTCRWSAVSPPLSSTPVCSMVVHGALAVSSLSAQFGRKAVVGARVDQLQAAAAAVGPVAPAARRRDTPLRPRRHR